MHGWREAVARAVNMAAEDPEAFSEELKILAKRFGLSVEQVYAKLQEDPEWGAKLARNSLIKGAARWLKRELGI